MPIYEYRCLSCNEDFEALVGVGLNNNHKPKCPHCQGRRIEKLFSKFGFRSGNGENLSSSTCSTCTTSSCGTCKG